MLTMTPHVAPNFTRRALSKARPDHRSIDQVKESVVQKNVSDDNTLVSVHLLQIEKAILQRAPACDCVCVIV